ncbi:1,4-dihydroxy-2-naphthoate polyprenyltransferase [Dethiothermospora halolimnae]|uniref:1,4-dihydroxy-2-naphthoate polyprenyltransferase n=1 Tax=Dethiothermospora halolimnae TaxID=3114390 RepID=UPI003CCB7D74
MTLSSFLKLVEIQTKVASIIPFTLGTVYSLYRFNKFNLGNFIIMLISLVSIDMSTTAINNYMDYKKAEKTHGYNYESHNAVVKYRLPEKVVVSTIIILLMVAMLLGILLFINTNILVLIIGGISFAVGILYSFGPVPISRTPFGEIFSGFFMGFVIVFLSVYIHVYDSNIVNLAYLWGFVNLSIDIKEVVYILLISVPTVLGISNIMLANNLCDIEDDILNNRYTLPVYIGKDKGLLVFKILYYIIFIIILTLIVLRVIPIISLISLLTFIPVNKNIKSFYQKQTKKDTFILAVKNFIIINIIYIITITIAIIFK